MPRAAIIADLIAVDRTGRSNLAGVGSRAVLPVWPFNEALLDAFAGHTGFAWKRFDVLLVWGAAGSVVAVRRFRWDPRAE